jgi:hypothetical protein
MFLTTSVFSDKILGLDLHLMHVGKEICFAKSGSRFEDEEGASASRKLDSTLPRLEGDI